MIEEDPQITEIDRLKSRIFKNDTVSLDRRIAYWHFKSLDTVFVYGTFDILDRERIEYLAKVSDFGDRLIIGLRSDESVKKFFPERKLINDEETRAMVLAALRFVTRIEIIDEKDPLNLLAQLKPDVLVDSKNEPKETACYDIIKNNNGRIEFVD